ncbi:MAG: sporulation protein YqfD [Ruminococcus sp.]|jgi:similar to stage IV sporulation protein|nr:sporulation protein YqfD [Ruminococcus sp.]
MLDHLRGVIEFTIVTDSPEEFINTIRKSSVSARNLRLENGFLTGQCYGFDKKTLLKIAALHHAEFIETARYGFVFTAAKYRRRYGIIAGVAAALVMVFFLSNITMKINIYGNENMSDAEVLSVLDDAGIRIGSYLPNISLAAVERDIVSNVRDVAWAGIKRSGPIVSVEISEMTKKPELTPTNRPCNIVSAKNAQIVKIKSVPMGMLIPMLGDTVREGDILVSGVITGKLGNTYYVHAMGDITGRYSEKITFNESFTHRRLDYEDKFTRRSLRIFGFNIPLTPAVNTYENAEVNEEVSYFNILTLNLPIGIVNTEIRPYEVTEEILTPEAANTLLLEKTKRYEENFYLDEGVTIISKDIVYKPVEGGLSINVSYVLEANIAETQYIYVKNHR